MGGLVSRYYIERLGGKSRVRSLTMLGTPNLGSNSATPVCAFWSQWWLVLAGQYDQGACDMVPVVSPLLAYLNILPGSHDGVTYNVLTGWIGANPIIGFPNDCMVSVASARGLNFPTALFGVLHINGSLGFAIAGCGTGNGEMDDPDVRARIKEILLESNASGGGGSFLRGDAADASGTPMPTSTPIPSSPPGSIIGSASGAIGPVPTDVEIAMPSAQTSATFIVLASPQGGPTVQLYRPDSSQAFSNSPDVTYDEGLGFGGLHVVRYTIVDPDDGTWLVRLAGAEGQPYDVEALVPGGITVTAGAGAGHYDVGQAFDLSATVAINDVPYAGATVHAHVTKPDQTTADVAFIDAGGGSYTGTFADTSACGLYQITVIADGDDNGTPFSRQDRTLAFAVVPGNVILDPCDADSDDDGLTDKDEIDVYDTNPANADTDDDGYTDPREIALGKDPVAYCDIMRADVNHMLDPLVRGDGSINVLDLQAVAQLFGQGQPGIREDQNGDGALNVLDLQLIAQRFSKTVAMCA
jgi:hypothetical protein